MGLNLKALLGKVNNTTREALEAAAGLCMGRTHYDVEIEHGLLKFLGQQNADVVCICDYFGLNKSRLASDLGCALDSFKSGNARTPAFGPYLIKLLKEAWVLASVEYAEPKIRSGCILLALVSDDEIGRLMRQTSPELAKIVPETLRSKFPEIVQASIENAPSSTGALQPQPSNVTRKADHALEPIVFICYRREDSAQYADALYDRLLVSLKGTKVFRDADTLKGGMVFPDEIEEAVGTCDALLAVIGKKWLTAADHRGNRRLDDERDWVRLEVGAALRQRKVIIPCLVGGAKMPNVEDLPADLAGLPLRHGVRISLPHFRRDTQELVELLTELGQSRG